MKATEEHRADVSTQWIGSIEFTALDATATCQHIIELAKVGLATHIHLANAYTITLAEKSETFKSTLAAPAINFADGKPISWISRARRHSPRLTQVRGPQLFLDVLDKGQEEDIRHFLLGSSPKVLGKLEKSLLTRFPNLNIVGAESPPFRTLTSKEIEIQDAKIRASKAQIVWVGLGTPKQDFEALRLIQKIPVVAVAVGAAFDFAAGTSREAPKWVAAIGLEWLFRLACEPRRLWRRYIIGNMHFIRIVFSKHNSTI